MEADLQVIWTDSRLKCYLVKDTVAEQGGVAEMLDVFARCHKKMYNCEQVKKYEIWIRMWRCVKNYLQNYSQVNFTGLTEGYLNDNEAITIYLPDKNFINRLKTAYLENGFSF